MSEQTTPPAARLAIGNRETGYIGFYCYRHAGALIAHDTAGRYYITGDDTAGRYCGSCDLEIVLRNRRDGRRPALVTPPDRNPKSARGDGWETIPAGATITAAGVTVHDTERGAGTIRAALIGGVISAAALIGCAAPAAFEPLPAGGTTIVYLPADTAEDGVCIDYRPDPPRVVVAARHDCSSSSR